MSMFQHAIDLMRKLRAIHPDATVQVGDPGDRSTWKLHFPPTMREVHKSILQGMMDGHPEYKKHDPAKPGSAGPGV